MASPPHKAGWDLKLKVYSGLFELIDVVFWPNQARQTSALHKYSCKETKTGSRRIMSEFLHFIFLSAWSKLPQKWYARRNWILMLCNDVIFYQSRWGNHLIPFSHLRRGQSSGSDTEQAWRVPAVTVASTKVVQLKNSVSVLYSSLLTPTQNSVVLLGILNIILKNNKLYSEMSRFAKTNFDKIPT